MYILTWVRRWREPRQGGEGDRVRGSCGQRKACPLGPPPTVSTALTAAAMEEADGCQVAPYQRGLSFHVVLLFLKTEAPGGHCGQDSGRGGSSEASG